MLIHQGKVLKDETTLEENNVVENSFIVIMLSKVKRGEPEALTINLWSLGLLATVLIQIRSHAQKYFLKVQKSGANKHLPPPRPKRKARHPYPQNAPKIALPSHAIGSLPASNAPLLQPSYLYSSSDSHPLVGNPPASSSSSSSQNHASTKPVIQEEPGVSTAALPKNRCYGTTSYKEVTPRLPAVTESNDEEQSCDKPPRVMPNFAQVYRFIGSVFDPSTSGHLQKLKQMDPINVETVLLLMRNLSVNLTSPEFAEQFRKYLMV